jgi:predicted RNA-binding Zn ribbon-like protein
MEKARDPSPEGLRRVIDFINTRDIETGADELAAPSLLVSWLADRALIEADTPADEADLELARAVRESLRSLALANNGGAASEEARNVLNLLADQIDVAPRFGPEGARIEVASAGVRGALGRLLIDVFTAMQDGTWLRLKACRDEHCRWAFFDRSKNRSGAWCSMAECGNKAKTRAYRQRWREVSSPR